MTQYRVIRNSELSHAATLPKLGTKRQNTKYVKREMVNGQWRYWYPEDIEAQKRAQQQAQASGTNAARQEQISRNNAANKAVIKSRQAAGSTTAAARNEKFAANRANVVNKAQQAQKAKVAKSSGTDAARNEKFAAKNVAKTETINKQNTFKSKKGDDNMYNTNDRVYKAAQKQALKNKKFGDLVKSTLKRGHNKVMDLLNSIGDGTLDDKARKGVSNAKASVKNAPKNIKSKVQKGMDVVKDKLGFDERDAYRAQQKNEETARAQREVSYNVANAARNRSSSSEEYREKANKFMSNDAKYTNEKNKTKKASDDYYNTPLGKLDKAANKVSSAISGKKESEPNYDVKRSATESAMKREARDLNKKAATKNIQQQRQPAGDFASNRNAISEFDAKRKKRIYN